MSDYERVKALLRHTPFLVADGSAGEVKLVNKAEAFRMMNETGLFHSQVIMNAGRALENFAQLTGKRDRSFNLRNIATITGTPYAMAHRWLSEGILTASIRPASGSGRGREPLFAWRDAFVAGVCGSLRRQGVRLEILRKVSAAFVVPEGGRKKRRTTRRPVASTRS